MPRPRGIAVWIVTAHADDEMQRRGISRDVVAAVLTQPEQRFLDRPGREVFQGRFYRPDRGARRLIRAFVDVDRTPAEVVTVYQTSKIDKYWRREP